MAHVVFVEVRLTPEEWAWLTARADNERHGPVVEAARVLKKHIGNRIRTAAKERARVEGIELARPPRTRGSVR